MQDKKSKFMFEIPNDKEGEYFIYLVNKFLNKDTYEMTKRARGSRADKAKKDKLHPRSYDSYLPMKHAQRFQLYFKSAIRDDTVEYLRNEYHRMYEEKRIEHELSKYYESKLNRITNIVEEV